MQFVHIFTCHKYWVSQNKSWLNVCPSIYPSVTLAGEFLFALHGECTDYDQTLQICSIVFIDLYMTWSEGGICSILSLFCTCVIRLLATWNCHTSFGERTVAVQSFNNLLKCSSGRVFGAFHKKTRAPFEMNLVYIFYKYTCAREFYAVLNRHIWI